MPKANAQPTAAKATSGDVTRQRLLAASSSLIVERGWSAVTTRAVAERAGVNQALVHYHFGSIDSLRRESVAAKLEPEVQGLIDELLDDRPITESIHRMMRLLDRFDLGTDSGVLMAEAILQATRDPEVSEQLGGILGSWDEMLSPRLELAQRRGVIRSDIRAQRLTRVLTSFLDGYLIQRMADPAMDANATADTLIKLLSPPAKETT